MGCIALVRCEITQQISRKLLRMDVLTSETFWALNNEIIKQVTSSWSLFIQILFGLKRHPQIVLWGPKGKNSLGLPLFSQTDPDTWSPRSVDASVGITWGVQEGQRPLQYFNTQEYFLGALSSRGEYKRYMSKTITLVAKRGKGLKHNFPLFLNFSPS